MNPKSLPIKLGNPGSALYGVKLVALHVLARADGAELRVADVLERGWPDLFPHRDPYGTLFRGTFDYEQKMAERRHWMRIERDCTIALRDLRRKGLARSQRPEGWSAFLWLITPAGLEWRRADAQAFNDAVLADLASLPTAAAR